MEEYKIRSTSRSSAECEEIVLRETGRTRLVFKPLIVKNNRDENASLKGTFVFQKKLPSQIWEDQKDLNLSELVSGQYIKLELKSAELLKLINELQGLYEIYQNEGIPRGQTRYIKAKNSLSDLSKVNEEDLQSFFELNKKAGVNIFSRLLNYITNMENSELVAERLEKLEIDSLQKLNTLIGINNIKKIIENWRQNASNNILDPINWTTS